MTHSLIPDVPAFRVMALLLPLAVSALFPMPAAAQKPEASPQGRAQPSTTTFRVERLAEGVLLFRPGEDRHDLTNSLVVERDDGLLVIDAQPTPQAARLFLSDLQSALGEAPRYLVLSHPHAESAGGASAFPSSTLIIGSQGCKDALSETDFDFGAEARSRWRGQDGWEDPPRVPPTLVLFARTRLEDSARPVELLPLGAAHSPGDMLVQLPQQQIIYAGALLDIDRNPYASGSRISGWISALNGISKNRPAIVVPLRGQASALFELRVRRDALAWLRGQVELRFINGLDAPRIADSVLDSEELAEHYDVAAEPNFVRGLVEQIVAEAAAHRRKRGIN